MIRPVRRSIWLTCFFLVGTVLVGCGGAESASEKETVPNWYLETPQKPNYLYAAQSATSKQMQVAIDKATTNARGNLSASLETQIESMTKSFTEEVDGEMRQQYTEAQKEVTSQVLRGTRPVEKEVYQLDNGTWRAFVLMELPVGKAAEEIMAKLNSQGDEMYTRFRASEAYEEMKKAVEEYEKKQKGEMASDSQ